MSKRKNPFGEVAPIQLKTHVSSKYVASEEDMQEVYRRTRERLFKGAKVEFLKSGTTANGHDGYVPECKTNEGGQGAKGGDSTVCRCCRERVAASSIICSYCQCKLCGDSCLRECCICGQNFCQFCIVLNYDQEEVREFCLNCLSSFSLHS